MGFKFWGAARLFVQGQVVPPPDASPPQLPSSARPTKLRGPRTMLQCSGRSTDHNRPWYVVLPPPPSSSRGRRCMSVMSTKPYLSSPRALSCSKLRGSVIYVCKISATVAVVSGGLIPVEAVGLLWNPNLLHECCSWRPWLPSLTVTRIRHSFLLSPARLYTFTNRTKSQYPRGCSTYERCKGCSNAACG
jgi:hypothetical protein